MEMNTRIQVEHTVTEEVTGIDLVREQILVAAGEPLSIRQEDVQLRGHSIECRINAEDVANGFLPAPGRITAYREPSGPGVRVDSGVVAGSEITGLYDPMIAKLIVHGVDREHARMRMLRALDEFELGGPPTLLGFHKALLSHPCFVAGKTCHGIVESEEIALRAGELTRRRASGRVVDERARPPARNGRRGRRAPLRRDRARARATLGRARAPPARACGPRPGRRRQRGRRHPDAGDGAEGRGGRG